MQTNQKIKPFLTVSSITEETVTIGISPIFRVEIENTKGIKNETEIQKYIPYLNKINLTDENEGNIENRISRTCSYFSILNNKPLSSYKNFINKNILVLGAGGLGSRIVLELAAMGNKKITVVDHDIVEESNLQRMFWLSKSDIGRKKVDILKNKLSTINNNCKCNVYEIDSITFCKKKNLSCYDFIFITADADDGSMADKTGRILKDSGVPHLIGGYWESMVIIGPIFDNNSTTNLKQEHDKFSDKYRNRISRDFIPPSTGFTNSIISGIMINESVKYFNKSSTLYNNQFIMNLIDLRAYLNSVF